MSLQRVLKSLFSLPPNRWLDAIGSRHGLVSKSPSSSTDELASPPSSPTPLVSAPSRPSLHLRPAPSVGTLRGSSGTGVASQPPPLPQLMRTPTAMRLTDPELLSALDAHFAEQGGLEFLQMRTDLRPAFFVHMRVVETDAEAERLAEALWGPAPDEASLQALADNSALQVQLRLAASEADVTLDAAQIGRAVALLQLAALELRRTQAYNERLVQLQAHCRRLSASFSADDRLWAEAYIEASGMASDLGAFVAPAESPPQAALDDLELEPDEVRPLFKELLGGYFFWLAQARTPPTEREEGTFYPAPPAYDRQMHTTPIGPGTPPPAYEMPPGYRPALARPHTSP